MLKNILLTIAILLKTPELCSTKHKRYKIMKSVTFKQLIDHLIDKGVECIKIIRSDCFCGCINPKDIIAIEVCKNGIIYIASVAHVFDNPTIDVDRIVRDESGRCLSRWTVRQFNYAK